MSTQNLSKTPTVVLLATDLMFSSNVSGFAADQGIACVRCSTANEFRSAIAEASARHTLVILDLGIAQVDFGDIFDAIPDSVRLNAVAYAPHVHEEKLQAAENAEIGRVMSRGQFAASVGRIIHAFAKSGDCS